MEAISELNAAQLPIMGCSICGNLALQAVKTGPEPVKTAIFCPQCGQAGGAGANLERAMATWNKTQGQLRHRGRG